MRVYLAVLALGVLAGSPAAGIASELIPFVGCPGYSQGKTLETPTGEPLSTRLPGKIARVLALYDEVLAPRGWNCERNEGTGGGTLSITPPVINPDRRAGAVVQLDDFIAGTAGDYSIAAFGGRYFPKHIAAELVANVMERFKVTKSQLFIPRYPDDVVTYRTTWLLEFMTPPNRAGLGTSAYGIARSSLPTYGVLGLYGPSHEAGGVLLTLRLPPDLNHLHAPILKHFEQCLERFNEEYWKCESEGYEVSPR